ncbi:MAG: cephalosporin hydroxylase family protein [Fibromonadaceae bacterium]|jgi:cephalosporin hydroxylase|nr:cephalosporin hydroxylase family protein [Fibromonadaceae bacterium]
MDDSKQFLAECEANISLQGKDAQLQATSIDWLETSGKYKYSYNFQWMGRPIIQLPQDILMMQELIWEIKPDLIIETGVARGGSLVFYASMLELIGERGCVIGIDIDIREHNRREIEKHPMFKNIHLIEGSSISNEVLSQVNDYIKLNNCKKILVALDSNHTHSHVLEELRFYSPFVKKDSYIVVFDTVIEDVQLDFPDRPWGKGNNPKTAVWEFLKENDRFEIDERIDAKLLISVAPSGYLRCKRG